MVLIIQSSHLAFKQHQGVDNTKNVVMKRLESSLETLSAKMESNQDTDIIQGLFEKYSSE